MTKLFTNYEDPGHGWLEVPVVALQALGVADKISHYSYISEDGKLAYLEEDCDAMVFIRPFCESARIKVSDFHGCVEFKTTNSNAIFIRDLPSYRA